MNNLKTNETLRKILGSESFTRWLVLGHYIFIIANTILKFLLSLKKNQVKVVFFGWGGVMINWKFLVLQLSAE